MKIHELYSDESKWCRGASAITISGNPTHSASPEAVAWCLIGAVNKCYRENLEKEEIFNRIVEKIHEKHGINGILNFNDKFTNTFEQIKELVTELDV